MGNPEPSSKLKSDNKDLLINNLLLHNGIVRLASERRSRADRYRDLAYDRDTKFSTQSTKTLVSTTGARTAVVFSSRSGRLCVLTRLRTVPPKLRERASQLDRE